MVFVLFLFLLILFFSIVDRLELLLLFLIEELLWFCFIVSFLLSLLQIFIFCFINFSCFLFVTYLYLQSDLYEDVFINYTYISLEYVSKHDNSKKQKFKLSSSDGFQQQK